jgi:hypothetical protein
MVGNPNARKLISAKQNFKTYLKKMEGTTEHFGGKKESFATRRLFLECTVNTTTILILVRCDELIASKLVKFATYDR